MDGYPCFGFLMKKYMGSGTDGNKTRPDQACKDFCCSVKAELQEKTISPADRDPLSASYKK